MTFIGEQHMVSLMASAPSLSISLRIASTIASFVDMDDAYDDYIGEYSTASSVAVHDRRVHCAHPADE